MSWINIEPDIYNMHEVMSYLSNDMDITEKERSDIFVECICRICRNARICVECTINGEICMEAARLFFRPELTIEECTGLHDMIENKLREVHK